MLGVINLTMAGEFMYSTRRSITTTFPNLYISPCVPNTYYISTGKCSSHPKKLFFSADTITSIHNWSKFRDLLTVGGTSPVDTFIIQPLHLRLR